MIVAARVAEQNSAYWFLTANVIEDAFNVLRFVLGIGGRKCLLAKENQDSCFIRNAPLLRIYCERRVIPDW